MHNILIVNDETLNKLTNGGTATTTNDLVDLAPGALAIVADGQIVTDTNIPLPKTIQFVVGITPKPGITVQSSVPIATRNIESVDIETSKSPVAQKVLIGPFTAAAGTAEGEIGLTLNNDSYIGTIQTEQLRLNQWKKSSDTLVSVLQKMVDTINLGTGLPRPGQYQAFMTASLEGVDDDTKIKLVMKSEHVKFSSAAYGLAEGVDIITTVKPVLSKGMGVDVRRSEDEYSGNLGNGGYGWRNDLYYSKPLEAKIDSAYNIISIQFAGMHDTPQNKVRAATNWLQLAVDVHFVIEPLVNLLATIIPVYKSDDFNETDKKSQIQALPI